MRTDGTKGLTVLAAVLMLAGCAGMDGMALSQADHFGEATRQTLAAQVIDPDPAYEYADPTTSGQHAAAAVDRYRTDKVKKPDRVATSKVSGTGGGN